MLPTVRRPDVTEIGTESEPVIGMVELPAPTEDPTPLTLMLPDVGVRFNAAPAAPAVTVKEPLGVVTVAVVFAAKM